MMWSKHLIKYAKINNLERLNFRKFQYSLLIFPRKNIDNHVWEIEKMWQENGKRGI